MGRRAEWAALGVLVGCLTGHPASAAPGDKLDVPAYRFSVGPLPGWVMHGPDSADRLQTESVASGSLVKDGPSGHGAVFIWDRAGVGLGEAADVGKAVTSIVNSYGSANITAARAADILAATVKAGGAAASELAPTLANVIPIAAPLGISFEEVGANIATVTKLGVPAEQAVTQLASVMTALLKETNQGKEALAAYGFSYAGVRAEIEEKGLRAALQNLVTTFGDNKTALVDVVGRIDAVGEIGDVAAHRLEDVLGLGDELAIRLVAPARGRLAPCHGTSRLLARLASQQLARDVP